MSQRGYGVVSRKQAKMLLKSANIEFDIALQQTFTELDEDLGGISFKRSSIYHKKANLLVSFILDRWNRVLESTIPTAKLIKVKKMVNLKVLQQQVI